MSESERFSVCVCVCAVLFLVVGFLFSPLLLHCRVSFLSSSLPFSLSASLSALSLSPSLAVTVGVVACTLGEKKKRR